MNRFAGTVERLQADGVVKPGRWIAWIELLRTFELGLRKFVAQLVGVGLAQVAAQQRVLRVERHGGFDLRAAVGELAVLDGGQAHAEARERIGRVERCRLREFGARRRRIQPGEVREAKHGTCPAVVRTGADRLAAPLRRP